MRGTIGITRNIDDLGRVTIPKEYRKFFKMAERQRVEILATEEGILIRVPDRAVTRKDFALQTEA